MQEHEQKEIRLSDKKYIHFLTTQIAIYRIEIIIFIFWLCVYGFTTSHSVVPGDTGEFLASAKVQGVPHDPGFPLYSLITRIIYVISIVHTAWMINFTSAIFASVALVMTYRLVKFITDNIIAALFSVVTLGTYENFWFYASVAQIHTLQVLLLVLFTYFLILLIKTKSIKNLYTCAFIVGLGIAHSYTIIFVVPSLLLVLYFRKKNISVRILLKSLLVTISGLLLYGYTIWAASTQPLINWGRIHDFNSLLFMLYRGDYGFFSLGPQQVSVPFIYSTFVYYFQSLFISSWYIVPFAIISLRLLVKKNFIYLMLLCCFLLIGPFFYLLLNQPIISVTEKANVEQYLSYSFLYISIFAGLGVSLILKKYKNSESQKLIISGICFLFFLIPFLNTFNDVKLETDGFAASTIKYMLSEIPENGIIITTGDTLYFPSLYWQYFKNYRKDVTVINFTLSATWYVDNLHIQHPQLPYLTNPQKFYTYLCDNVAAKGKLFIYPWDSGFATLFAPKCTIIPYGFVEKVVPVKKVPDEKQIKSFNDTAWNDYSKQLSFDKYKNTSSRTREILLSLADQLTYIGIYYEQVGENNWAIAAYKQANEISLDEVSSLLNESTLLYKHNDIGTAIALLKEGINRNPAAAILYKDLGVYYLKENNRSEAYQYFVHYLNFNPADPNISAIEYFVSSYQLNG